MTFIQPNKDSRINIIVLFCLSFLLVAAAFYLVILYNRVVNFEHGISNVRLQLKNLEAQNMEAENKIFSLIDSSKLVSLSSGKFVQDKNPEYFEVNPKWSYASQY